MSQPSSESLEDRVGVCAYHPLCDRWHEVWQCVRLGHLTADNRRIVAIEKRICLDCNTAGVRADGWGGQCDKGVTKGPPTQQTW
jgi:hypothetical protein